MMREKHYKTFRLFF